MKKSEPYKYEKGKFISEIRKLVSAYPSKQEIGEYLEAASNILIPIRDYYNQSKQIGEMNEVIDIKDRIKMLTKLNEMMGEGTMKAYKALIYNWPNRKGVEYKDMTDNDGYKYEVGESYKAIGNIEETGKGFTACINPFDCFNTCPIDPEHILITEVLMSGKILGADSKRSNSKSSGQQRCSEIKILRILDWGEVFGMLESGKYFPGTVPSDFKVAKAIYELKHFKSVVYFENK